MEGETKLCTNCKRQISAANFTMHEVHCRRHIVLCDKCKEPFPTSEIEQHKQEQHVNVNCPKCGMEMEKNKLEEHEENQCRKKKQHCYFCELEFSQDQLEDHLDFCGSRTEQCFKCKQYVMLKDQVQHENTNCTYPAPKPSNVATAQNNAPDPLLFHSEENYVDPFMFDEISRMLNQTPITHPVDRLNTSTATGSSVVRNETNAKKTNVDNSRTNKQPGRNVTAPSNTRRNVESRRIFNGPEKRKMDLNRQREIGGQRRGGNVPTLVSHLARDLDREDDLEVMIRNLEKSKKPAQPQSENKSNLGIFNHNVNSSETHELSLIPCEFCGNPFPADELFHHQSSCSDDPLSSMMPEFVTNQLRDDPVQISANQTSSHNREERRIPLVNSEQLPKINNLREDEDPNWSFVPNETFNREQTMLPCEFCDELFPLDSLCQHQANCDTNADNIFRGPSPTIAQPLKEKTHTKNMFKDSVTTRGRRDSLDSSDEDINLIMQQTTTNELENMQQAWAHPHDLRSTLQKYGVEGDRGNDLYLRPHGYNHYAENMSSSDEEKRNVPAAATAKRRDSATRTRNTLDQLLQDTNNIVANDYDLLAHMPASNRGRNRRTENVSSHSKSTGASSGPRPTQGTKSHKKTISAKDVQRELDSQPLRPTPTPTPTVTPSRLQARTRHGQDQTGGPAAGQRRRTRANHVFSNGASSYKTDSKVPSRRSGDKS